MRLRGFWTVFATLGAGLSWILGDSYYAALQLRGEWRLMGSGSLWDSSWVARSIEATEGPTPEKRLWNAYKALKETALFEKVQIYYTGTGVVCLQAHTRQPVARVALPLRQFYVDAEGHRLPLTRPLDLPIIETPRWDSTAIETFLRWWKAKPWYHQAVSRLYQRPDGLWIGYLEISSETFHLGRTPHLPTALQQWDVYLRAIQLKEGGYTFRTILLYIPGQIVCERA